MEVAIVFLALFATIFGISYVYLNTRNKERLSLIEKGAQSTMFDRAGNKFSIAKFILNLALLLVGIGVGIYTGWMASGGTGNRFNEVYIISFIFVFGGLGLIVGFFVTRSIEKKDNR